MRKSIITFGLFASLLAASAAIAWHPDYAWHDVAAPTSSPSIKPGGAGLYGTGAKFEGGIRCEHCHLPATVSPPLDVTIAFNPSLSAGRYALSTRYTITVAMVNEQFLFPDGGTKSNNFAGVFEDANGALAGTLESDSGQLQTSCPSTLPTLPAAGTTMLYGDCHGILSRSQAKDLKSWTFYWTSPSSSVGPITLWYGAVDGNGNDRTIAKDGGGPDDAVKMGSLTLQP